MSQTHDSFTESLQRIAHQKVFCKVEFKYKNGIGNNGPFILVAGNTDKFITYLNRAFKPSKFRGIFMIFHIYTIVSHTLLIIIRKPHKTNKKLSYAKTKKAVQRFNN